MRAFAAMLVPVALFASLATASVAYAADKICVVDAEKAINDTKEGKDARARLEGMYASKQTELEKQGKKLEADFKDYEQRAVILSDDARQKEEQSLLQQQQALQQAAMMAEQEMQQTYAQLLSTMEAKLVGTAQVMAAEKGCTVLLQKAAVFYFNTASVTDLTGDLIRAYDAK